MRYINLRFTYLLTYLLTTYVPKPCRIQQTFFVDEYIFGDGNARLGSDDRSNSDIAQLRKLPDGDGQLTADLS